MKLFSFAVSASLLFKSPKTVNAVGNTAGEPSSFFDNVDYLEWLKYKSYQKSTFLKTSVSNGTGVGLFWNISGDSIHIAVACPCIGWCGFGIAEAGGMKGSDMVIFESQTNNLFDAYILDEISSGPVSDSCQNWNLTNHFTSSNLILFEAHRLLDTGDTFDHSIIDDSSLSVPPTRIIAAWGDSDTVSYHGNNRLRHSIRFYGQESDDEALFRNTMEEQAEGVFELRALDFSVPQEETFYGSFCFSLADLIKRGVPEGADLHMIGIEPIIDKDAANNVHHFVLTASFESHDGTNISASQEHCQNATMTEVAYVWAPGEGSFAYPDVVGGPLGVNGYKSFRLEIHYNNPSLQEGIRDSSGIRIYFTSKKRENDLGILQLGDPFVSLFNKPIGNGLVSHTFDCPSSCSLASVSQPLTVIREYLHMHRTGQRMYSEQIRNGKVIRQGVVDYWDFDQNGDFAVQQPQFDILPGDAFRTRCYFSSENEVWGLGSQDEMCISFLSYYPRQVVDTFPYICGAGLTDIFPDCDAQHTSQGYSSVDEFQHSFGSPGGSCKSNFSDDKSTSGSKKAGELSVSLCLLVLFLSLGNMFLLDGERLDDQLSSFRFKFVKHSLVLN